MFVCTFIEVGISANCIRRHKLPFQTVVMSISIEITLFCFAGCHVWHLQGTR